MVSNFCPRRESLRIVLLLLFLAGLVSACGASITSSSSTTPNSTQASNSTPTPKSTQGIRGIFHEYALPLSQFVPFALTAGPDGNLWFIERMQNQNGSVQTGKIARLTPTGTLSEFSLPSANASATDIITGPEFTLSPSIIPGGITGGPDSNLWFTEFQYDETGTTAGQIGRISTAGKVSDFLLPTASNSPTSITFGTDHTLWFIEVEVTPTNPNGMNGKIGHLV